VVLKHRAPDWRWIGLRTLAHARGLLPLALLARGALGDTLGGDPVAAITHEAGDWTLRLLLLGLAMTPIRRLTGQPWPIRFRRAGAGRGCILWSTQRACWASCISCGW